MNQIKITCPSCKATFSADEALRDHLKAKDAQHAKEIANNKKIAQAKYDLQLKMMEKKAIQKAEKEHFEKAKKHIQEHKAKVELEIKKEAESVKKAMEKKAQEESKAKIKAAQVESEKLKKEILQKDKAREIQDKRYEKRIDEMKKQLNQKSVEVQGEVQEELIQDFLRNTFPEDTIEEVKKGEKGADCLFTINYKDKKNLAQIYFESKDHKSFKEEWVSKLLKDMKDKNIGRGILITTALPKDLKKNKNGYVGRHGNRIIIIPMDYSIIHAVVGLIRGHIINAHKFKKDFNASKELTKLWDHITGPSFQIPLRTLFQSINEARSLLETKKTYLKKQLSKEERNVSSLHDEFIDLINSFTKNVSDKLLPESLLQLEVASKIEEKETKKNNNTFASETSKADN